MKIYSKEKNIRDPSGKNYQKNSKAPEVKTGTITHPIIDNKENNTSPKDEELIVFY